MDDLPQAALNQGVTGAAAAGRSRREPLLGEWRPRRAVDRIEAAVADEAWAWLRQHDERPYSFVDATSFALMRKLRIEEPLAFHGDFAAAGFVELRPSSPSLR